MLTCIWTQTASSQFCDTPEEQTVENLFSLHITKIMSREISSQVTYVTVVPRVGNETLRPLGVAMGERPQRDSCLKIHNLKTPSVGWRQPMTSLPA